MAITTTTVFQIPYLCRDASVTRFSVDTAMHNKMQKELHTMNLLALKIHLILLSCIKWTLVDENAPINHRHETKLLSKFFQTPIAHACSLQYNKLSR